MIFLFPYFVLQRRGAISTRHLSILTTTFFSCLEGGRTRNSKLFCWDISFSTLSGREGFLFSYSRIILFQKSPKPRYLHVFIYIQANVFGYVGIAGLHNITYSLV